eukprot:6181946-Pleurochrysis_carterae.AAC.2
MTRDALARRHHLGPSPCACRLLSYCRARQARACCDAAKQTMALSGTHALPLLRTGFCTLHASEPYGACVSHEWLMFWHVIAVGLAVDRRMRCVRGFAGGWARAASRDLASAGTATCRGFCSGKPVSSMDD